MLRSEPTGRDDPSVPPHPVLPPNARTGHLRRLVRLGAVRVRRLGLRLIALALVCAGGLAAALILLAYRPGGPLDVVVGITMLVPVAIAIVGFAWPPITRGPVSHALIVALGFATLLVLLPSIGGVLNQLQALGSQTLMPSLEAAYPWLLALVGTSLFTGFGQARRLIGGAARRRHRLRLGIAIAAASTLVAGAAFGGAAIANEISLRDSARPASASRFGPTGVGTEATPPPCDAKLVAGTTSRLGARFTGTIDGQPIGTVDVVGVRRGLDFRWLAYVATNHELGQYGEARLGQTAWVRTPARGWETTPTDSVDRSTLDLQATQVALTYGARATAEDRGIEVIEGARARRCRVSVDGPAFRATFPQVAWLVGNDPLAHWFGQLDYWIFLDGGLGQVAGSVNGEAGGIQEGAIQGTVEVVLTATERGAAFLIYPPAR
jgi:hypothetical protein